MDQLLACLLIHVWCRCDVPLTFHQQEGMTNGGIMLALEKSSIAIQSSLVARRIEVVMQR